MVAIICEDGTVLNCAHVAVLEVLEDKGQPSDRRWKVRARTVLNPEYHMRTIFDVSCHQDEDDARQAAVRYLTGAPF